MVQNTRWWGEFEIKNHQCIQWKIGFLSLFWLRKDQELRVAYHTPVEESDEGAQVIRDSTEPFPDEYQRFVFGTGPERLKLMPILPVKSIIFSPEKALYLAPREKLRLYLSAPIWLRISTGEPELELLQIPSIALSETWFGNNHREGEVCYAAQTRARLNIDNLSQKAYRATTAVTIFNNTAGILPFDRIRIPFQYLALYFGGDGFFWTQPIQFELEPDHNTAKLSLPEGPPTADLSYELVAKAQDHRPHHFLKVLNSFIRSGARL